MVARVSVESIAIERLFDYSVPPEYEARISVGSRVRVEFGRRLVTGYVVELTENSDYFKSVMAATTSTAPTAPPTAPLLPGFDEPQKEKSPKLKPIVQLDGDTPVILPSLVKLARWMAQYYCAPTSRCLQALLPAPVRTGHSKEKVRLYVDPVDNLPDGVKLTSRQRELYDNLARVGGGWMQQVCAEFKCSPETVRNLVKAGAAVIEEKNVRRDPFANRRIIPTKPLRLNEEQAEALRTIEAAAALIDDRSQPPPKPVLLFGVTGSGKTEVYLQAIASVLNAGKGAIVLVPEIALTPQTVQRFRSRFGEKIAVLHSALSDGERFDEWKRIRCGEARVVVGPRSAVFAPVEELGLIIVDEEHEPSYKQDETPRYNARDVAVMRAHTEHCVVVLGSATPGLESWKNFKTGKYCVARLTRRASEDAVMPLVHIVDMRREAAEAGGARLFSKELLDAVHDRLNRNEQVILFLNRRGFSTSLVCPECGYVATCEACDVAYTYHRHDDCLRCHLCGDWKRPSQRCPDCGSAEFKYAGYGTQRVEDIVSKCFPHASIARMDADSTSRKYSHDDILADFRSGKTQILIGTQMIAKGLHFPNVTLVGIVMADSSLHIPDFRAGERTFQLLAQVSGRTGRGAIPGEVYVQTYTPDHQAVQMARTENFEGFAEYELAVRNKMWYPPYSHLSCLVFTGENENEVARFAGNYAAQIRLKADATVKVSEPCPALIAKVNNQYRYQLVIRSGSIAKLMPVLNAVLKAFPAPETIKVSVDIDALSLM